MGKKLKWGFKSSKQQKRLEKISYSTSKRNNNNNTNPESQIRPSQASEQSENPIHNDHDYCVRSPEIEVETQIEHHHAPIHEGSDYWREGRRIVELDVLANALSGCVKCGQPLQLCNATDIANYGLSAILKIPCYNPTCHHVNNVPTGKRHKGVWDANSKLAMAMVHCGMGGTQVNGFLNALNIPAVSNTLLYKREKEIGDALEDVAQCSAEKSFNEEIELTKSASNDDGLTVSVDAGWQKRGSGRSYDSLSGHCSMIGANTGKVLSYSVRSKYCKVCDMASTKGVKPKQHDCRMNWTGSSKAMEQDMVIEMMKSCAEKGEAVDTIIADDDTTTISRIKQSVNPNIKKKSDKNHVKKNIGNALYSLKRNHRKLQNPKVFKYIQRCINYMLAQNQNNPKGVETGLEAISRHPFGDHSLCNASWCSHIENPKQKFTSLPFGKPLKDDLLQEDLRKLMSSYKLHSKKLSQMGSTQSNESFNKIVSSKAPKTNFYSGSASLNRRIASAVAQKNEGQSYMLQVYRKVGVSPGIHTKKMLFMKDKLSKKRRVMISSRKYKQRRLELKNRRSKSNAVSELREGTCYSTGVDLQGSEDITEIPQPRVQPQMENESDAGLPQVIFDLETTGLGRDSHITQIAAACGGEHWQSYVKPKKKISHMAAEKTGISSKNGQLFYMGSPVSSKSITSALDDFFAFISRLKPPVILLGHNIKCFDCHVLLNALKAVDNVQGLASVAGFMDTKILIRSQHPGLPSYSQESLVSNFLHCEYSAHNALEDVLCLQRLISSLQFNKESKEKAFFSTAIAIYSHESSILCTKNVPSLQPLLQNKIISLSMAKKIAASNLDYSCLKLSYSRGEEEGIRQVLSEKCDGKPRVTNSSKVIHAISEHFRQILCPET